MDFKTEGNNCFKAGKYAEAVDWYTKGIESDANNAILYSNRSGAYCELKDYDKAIHDAKKSLALQPSAKAHSRMGAAYWKQNRLEQALAAYEMASALAPTDANISDNISKLKQKMGTATQQTRHAAPPPPALTGERPDAALDLAIVVLTALQVVGSLVFPQFATLLWKLLLVAMLGRSGLILKRQGLLQPNLETLKTIVKQFAGQYFVLCLILMFVPIQPMPTLMGAIVIYAIVDIACSQKGAAIALLPPLDRFSAKIDAARQNRDGLLINAAMCEIAGAFISMFTGNFMFGMLYLQFFLKFRYRNDSYAKFAWGYLAQTLGKAFYHPRCPLMLTTVFDKIKSGMHMMATR